MSESIYDIKRYINTNKEPSIGDIVLHGTLEKRVISINGVELFFKNEDYPLYVAEVSFVKNPIKEIKEKLKKF